MTHAAHPSARMRAAGASPEASPWLAPRRLRRIVGVACLAATAGLACAGAIEPPEADAAARLTKAERAVVKLINAERAKRGLRKLRVRVTLSRAADRHSREMLRRQYFGHRSANGGSVATRVARAGYLGRRCARWSVGETLAGGAGLYATPQVVVRMFLRSKRHRAVLLSRRWRDIGVGRIRGTFRGQAATTLTTVDFGLRVTW